MKNNQRSKGGHNNYNLDDEIEDNYGDDAFVNEEIIDDEDEDLNSRAAAALHNEMEGDLQRGDDEDEEDEEEDDINAMDEEDQEAETVQMNGVAAARGRRLKPSQNTGGDRPTTSGGNGMTSQSMKPYEAMPALGGGAGQSRGGLNHQLQGSSNSLGMPQNNSQSNKLRPASAKTGVETNLYGPGTQGNGAMWIQPPHQHQQQLQNYDPSQQQQQYSFQQMPSQQQQQAIMQQQQYGVGPYGGGGVHPSFLYNNNGQSPAQILLKKRPITAANNRGGVMRSNVYLNAGIKKPGFPNKNPSTIDLEVSRMRPKNIKQERERLYDDALKQKMISNLLKDENVKLKTKIHILESELSKKERLVDELILQQDNFQMMSAGTNGVGSTKNAATGSAGQKMKIDSHLAANLKRKVKELQTSNSLKQNEIESLKRHIKSTKIAEIEVEMKLYMDECTRMRQQLEEVIRSKDTFADPQEVRIIEERFQQQDMIIMNLRNENGQLLMAIGQRDQELGMFREQQEKQKKGVSKEASSLKKKLKEKERELTKLKADIQTTNARADEFRTKVEELMKQRQNQNNSNIQYGGGRPSTSHQAQGGDDTQKVRELNNVIQQLQSKLQDKQSELQKETSEKQKFKDLYEKYQGQLAQLQAHQEEGVNHQKKVQQSNSSYENNIATKQQRLQSAKPNKRSIPIVDPKQLEDTILELKLKLQVKGFYSNQIKDYFFKPYQSEVQITIKKLRDTFEFNGLSEKKAELLARFLVEPRTKGQVDFDEERTASQRSIIAQLEEHIGHYKLYNASDSQSLIKKIQKLLSGCRDTLKETLELEDYDEIGAIPISAFKEAFQTLDLDLDQELLDFIFYVVYQKSESLDKMRYSVLFDLLDGKLPGLNATSSEGGRKRPESSSPEKLKARNKEKFQGIQQMQSADQQETAAAGAQEGQSKGAKQAKGAAANSNIQADDNYEEEFEQLLDKDDEEGEDDEAVGKMNSALDPQRKAKAQAASKEEQEDGQDEQQDKNEEDDDYIDEEEMLDIAERCFVRVAEAILEAGISVREEFEGEALELLSPIGFLEGVKDLGVTDLEEVEVACLMRVLTKADLENAILLRELIVIMENFGIQDDEGDEEAMGGMDERSAEVEGENPTPGKNNDASASKLDGVPSVDDSGQQQSSKKKKKKKNAVSGPQVDLSQLDEKSIKILAKLMLALMELNVSLYDFFDGAIYEQAVKTKTKESKVEIIPANDFFLMLKERGVRKSDKSHENLQKFLQLDPNYPHLIMLKKVAKALDEMAKNEELMEGILAAAMGADMDDGEEGGRVGGGEIELPDEKNERLGTIGEDGDEDKHIYDTNTQNHGNKSSGALQARGSASASGAGGVNTSSKKLEGAAADAQYDEDYEF